MAGVQPFPRSFGHYTLVTQLHSGATANYLLALPRFAKESDPWSVLQQYSSQVLSPTFKESLLQESLYWEKLSLLSGVVATQELGCVEDKVYRLSPYFPSKDAQKILTRCFHLQRKTPPAVALEIAAQAANTLSEVFETCQWTHRTLRPSHVLIGYDGRVKLLDFGLAKEQIKGPDHTPLGMFYLSYAAPEIASKTSKHTLQSDLFTVGIVLYELLTNTKLFPATAPSYEELAKVVTTARFSPPSQSIPGLAKSVDEFVKRALSPSPETRFQSGREFAKHARQLASTLSENSGVKEVELFLQEIFANEITQENEGLAALRIHTKQSLPPGDTSSVEIFSSQKLTEVPHESPAETQPIQQPDLAPSETSPKEDALKDLRLPSLQTTSAKPPESKPAAINNFFPEPEITTEEQPSTSPLISINDIRAPKPETSNIPRKSETELSPSLAGMASPPQQQAPPSEANVLSSYPNLPKPSIEALSPVSLSQTTETPKPQPVANPSGVPVLLPKSSSQPITPPPEEIKTEKELSKLFEQSSLSQKPAETPPKSSGPKPDPLQGIPLVTDDPTQKPLQGIPLVHDEPAKKPQQNTSQVQPVQKPQSIQASPEKPYRPKPSPEPAVTVPLEEAPPRIRNGIVFILVIISFALLGALGGWFVYRYILTPEATPGSPTSLPVKEYKYLVYTEPEGASIFVDGKEMDMVTPISLFLPFAEGTPTLYKVTLSLPGYLPYELELGPQEEEPAPPIQIVLIPDPDVSPTTPQEPVPDPEDLPQEEIEKAPAKPVEKRRAPLKKAVEPKENTKPNPGDTPKEETLKPEAKSEVENTPKEQPSIISPPPIKVIPKEIPVTPKPAPRDELTTP